VFTNGVRVLLLLFVAGFLALFVWGIVRDYRDRPRARAERAAALEAAPSMMQSLARPGAIAVGNREFHETGYKSPDFANVQEFIAPGSFSETVAWYDAHLRRNGWSVADPNGVLRVARFRKDPWWVHIAERSGVSELPDPSCRYHLELEWVKPKRLF